MVDQSKTPSMPVVPHSTPPSRSLIQDEMLFSAAADPSVPARVRHVRPQ